MLRIFTLHKQGLLIKRFISSPLQSIVIVMILCATLTNCMVGPNFHPPAPPRTNSYTEAPKPIKTINAANTGKKGKAQHFLYEQDIPGDWWTIFHSSALNELIKQGLAHNSNLAAAKAALLQTQQLFYAQAGSTLLPAVTTQFNGERQRFSGASSGLANTSSLFNLFNVPINITYSLDVFGGLRRQIEAAGAQVAFQRFELDAAFLTLSSNIVTTAITIASLREQIKATYDLIRYQRHALKIINAQFELGGTSKAEVLQQRAQVAQTEATLPALKQNLIVNYHALSVLIGSLPSDDHHPQFDLKKLHLPSNLPVSLPSLLVRQRPDIRAAEAQVHVTSAQIGVATANLLPQITLNGSYGWESTILSQLFDPTSKYWSWGGQIAQTIFNGGALLSRRRAAIAAFEQSAAQYRQTVLQAFQNVADTLRALQHDAQALKAQKAAEIAAKQALDLTFRQYRLGGVNYISLLTAQRTYQQARINRIIAEAARYIDTAALFQALGGGWWNRMPLECNPSLIRNVCQYTPDHFMPALCALCPA
jgi:NodT family efflux transporter outer membrane factor (OMF) lipoprotein